MKKSGIKLQLNRETITKLNDGYLAEATGGLLTPLCPSIVVVITELSKPCNQTHTCVICNDH